MRGATRSLLALAAVVSLVGSAHADEIGAAGTVASVQVNTAVADTYLSFHGQMMVKNSAGVLDLYRWGGTTCGSRVLTEPQVAALHRALGDKKTRVEPRHQIGQGDFRCLVGFHLVAKSFAKDILP